MAIAGTLQADDKPDNAGTHDQVITGLRRLVIWGANHLILSHGAYPSSLWSEETLELFGREVPSALRGRLELCDHDSQIGASCD